MTGRDEILKAAIQKHDLLYGMGHCDRKYLLSCHQMPNLILGLPRPGGEAAQPPDDTTPTPSRGDETTPGVGSGGEGVADA